MKRNAPLRRKKPINKQSKKRKALAPKRKAFVAEQLKERLYCEAGPKIGEATGFWNANQKTWMGCWLMATELHEPLTRARAPGPETILDKANSVAVCPACHRWIHEHVALSEEIGLLIRSGGLPL